jgi:FkbM family methyltransferase
MERQTEMNTKALARFLYANIPGLAAIRFAAKDLTASYFSKPEYQGVVWLSIKEGLIVDVGANRGQSIAAFKRLGPRANIVAFEPEPRSARRLAKRYQKDRNVAVHECALSGKAGIITFFVPSYGIWDCDGMAATDHKAATEWLSDPGRMYRYDPSKLTVAEHQVACETLDSYGLSPVLIKLHAQGAELDILKGSLQTIRQHRPALMCAFPSPAVTSFLAGFGYRPHIYGDGRFVSGTAKPPVTFTWYFTDDHLQNFPPGTHSARDI